MKYILGLALAVLGLLGCSDPGRLAQSPYTDFSGNYIGDVQVIHADTEEVLFTRNDLNLSISQYHRSASFQDTFSGIAFGDRILFDHTHHFPMSDNWVGYLTKQYAGEFKEGSAIIHYSEIQRLKTGAEIELKLRYEFSDLKKIPGPNEGETK